MKKLLISSFALCLTGAAHAGLPLLNATCPGDISMHADKGGPVYINGKKAKLKKSNENYFEATGAGVTISISINPDGSAIILYTGKQGANGVCQLEDYSAGSSSSLAPKRSLHEWFGVGMVGHMGDTGAAPDPKAMARVHIPEQFKALLAAEVRSGTTLMLTDYPVLEHTTGIDMAVLSSYSDGCE
jgi:hypothetical protein